MQDIVKSLSSYSQLIYKTNITSWLVGVAFNAPLDTIYVISEAVFTANHLTDTDKQNSTGKYRKTNSVKIRSSKPPQIQQNKSTLVQLPLTTLGRETRWAYSTTPPSPHGAKHYKSHCRSTTCTVIYIQWRKSRRQLRQCRGGGRGPKR